MPNDFLSTAAPARRFTDMGPQKSCMDQGRCGAMPPSSPVASTLELCLLKVLNTHGRAIWPVRTELDSLGETQLRQSILH